MKKLAVLALLFALPAFAAHSVTMFWDASPETDVVSYRIYKTQTKGQYTFGAANALATVASPTLTYQALNISDTVPTFFVVTAVNSAGLESLASNEVNGVAPRAPTNLRLSIP